MTAKVERLVNLTVALLDARRPMTLGEIRDRLPGYDQSETASARRMFERDKDDLRRLGVPIETVPLGAFEAEWGYSIDHHDYAMPSVDLSVEEVSALAVALQLAGDGDARRGFTKLAALAPDPRENDRSVVGARVEVDTAPLEGVADALLERRRLTFDYRRADGRRSRRRLDPYGVVQRRGAWYLVGHDHDRDDLRVFRLDRMVDQPTTVGEAGAFEVPEDLDATAAVQGPASTTVSARVALSGELAWEVERRGGVVVDEREDGWVLARFDEVDSDRFLPWVLGHGPRAEVVAPERLRREAARRLRGVLGANPLNAAATGDGGDAHDDDDDDDDDDVGAGQPR